MMCNPFSLFCKPKKTLNKNEAFRSFYQDPTKKNLKRIIKSGFSINSTDNDGENFLFYCVRSYKKFDKNAIKYLLNNGCNVYHKNIRENNILHAIFSRYIVNKELLKILHPFCKNMINEKNSEGETPLTLLCENYYTPYTLYPIIKWRPNFGIKDNLGFTPFYYLFNIITDDDENIIIRNISLLNLYSLNLGIDFYETYPDGNTILHEIIANGNLTRNKLAICLYFDKKFFNRKNDFGQTPLMFMLMYCKNVEEYLSLLGEVDITLLDDNFNNSLFYFIVGACNFSNKVLQYLLSKCSIKHKNKKRQSILYQYVKNYEKLELNKLDFLLKRDKFFKNVNKHKTLLYFNFKNNYYFSSYQINY